jgi:lysophospholipase L1-like esterase
LSAASPEDGRPSVRLLWTVLAAVLVVGLIVLAASAEFGIRWFQERKHGGVATVEQTYRLDERLGLRVPVANLRLERIQTSSLGFRGPEIVLPKPPGTLRIAYLGASTTWCAEVSGNDKVWAHLVAEDLRLALADVNVDYVNAGVPGYVAKSSRSNLQHRVAPTEPDIVVIYHATNDLSVELRRLAAARGVTRQASPQPPSWLATHSVLWNLAEKNLRIWLAQLQAAKAVGRLELDASTLGEGFRADLTALVRDAQRQAGVVALATFSHRLRRSQGANEQLESAASALYYMPFMTPAGLLDAYERYNQVIREVARDTGALLIEGEHDIPGDARHFTDSVHFTDDGARAMASRVSAALTRSPDVAALAARRAPPR